MGVYRDAGRRADAWTARARAWLVANEHELTVVSTAIFGVILALPGLVLLL